jgi:hypothetical protein
MRVAGWTLPELNVSTAVVGHQTRPRSVKASIAGGPVSLGSNRGPADRRCAAWLRVALWCAITLVAAGSGAGSDERTRAESRSTETNPSPTSMQAHAHLQGRLEPAVEGGLSLDVRFLLRAAFNTAADRLRAVDSCAALFHALGANGLEKLAAATYHAPARGRREREFCLRRGGAAFTEINGTQIAICPVAVGRLTRWEAAMILIHEALHHAGFPEAPAVPGALTSREINRLVRRSCRL